MKGILQKFKPECLVIQCSADALAGDIIGRWSLSSSCLTSCVKFLCDTHLPAVILGGGGYNVPNVAKYWAQITATLNDLPIPLRMVIKCFSVPHKNAHVALREPSQNVSGAVLLTPR